MHGPQSYEGSGGESSGDEADLDRFFLKSRLFKIFSGAPESNNNLT